MGQDDADNDLYFVVSGSFRVFVNGREVAERGPGQHLGEMAIIDPSSRRTATVAASAPSVVAKMSGAAYLALANEHPEIWRTTALAAGLMHGRSSTGCLTRRHASSLGPPAKA